MFMAGTKYKLQQRLKGIPRVLLWFSPTSFGERKFLPPFNQQGEKLINHQIINKTLLFQTFALLWKKHGCLFENNSQAVFVGRKFCDLDQNVSSEKDEFCAFFIIAIFHKFHL